MHLHGPKSATFDDMAGHLFIINGDLTKVACDAILLPTSEALSLRRWKRFLNTHHKEELTRLRTEGFRDNLVLHLDRIGKEPRIWLGNVGQVGNSSDFSVFAPYIEDFVSRALDTYNRSDHADRIHDWGPPRFAVNVVGSGRGGGAKKKGHLIVGLVRKLRALARNRDVDMILVTHGDKQYAAAQRARRTALCEETKKLDGEWHFSDQPEDVNLHEEAQRLAGHAIENHLVLFIGAGISRGAGLPLWKDLLSHVAKESVTDNAATEELKTIDLRDQATILERRLLEQRKSLRDDVAARLEAPCYALGHGLLASLPSKEAVTTNYDRLFEMARTTAQRRLAVLPDDPVDADGNWLLKLHGTVTRRHDMVLTRSDYLDMPRQYGALMGLVQGLLMMRHMMFVGYSLQDEDFHELVHEVRFATKGRSSHGPLATVLTLDENILQRELWSKELQFVPMTKRGTPPSAAARQLEVFLDLVGYLSTTSAAFFLDPTYAAVSGERELRDALSTLAEQISEQLLEAKLGSVAYKVRHFLRHELGLPPTRSRKDRLRPTRDGQGGLSPERPGFELP